MTHSKSHPFKPILVLDFDGVIHRYDSPWNGTPEPPDPPVEGALEFIHEALEHFDIYIMSSRANLPGGVEAMQAFLLKHNFPTEQIKIVTEKPPAFLYIDDRGFCFDGRWPDPKDLLDFKPWNKRDVVNDKLVSRALTFDREFVSCNHCALNYNASEPEQKTYCQEFGHFIFPKETLRNKENADHCCHWVPDGLRPYVHNKNHARWYEKDSIA